MSDTQESPCILNPRKGKMIVYIANLLVVAKMLPDNAL
jgi:hypothetical protein